MAPKPRRVVTRPDPATWSCTELMSLAEAAALMWPEKGSPVTASTLRTAYRSGILEVVVIARKILVNKQGLAAMTENARRRKART
jgi:hypothetical protein